jgi:hypothetical protein
VGNKAEAVKWEAFCLGQFDYAWNKKLNSKQEARAATATPQRPAAHCVAFVLRSCSTLSPHNLSAFVYLLLGSYHVESEAQACSSLISSSNNCSR